MVSPFDPRFFQEQRSRHAPPDWPSPAAEAAVRAAKRRASGRSVAQSLDGRWSGGYPATDAQPCIFNTFTRSNRRVYAEQLLKSFFLLAD
jgi:hypothetical protein